MKFGTFTYQDVFKNTLILKLSHQFFTCIIVRRTAFEIEEYQIPNRVETTDAYKIIISRLIAHITDKNIEQWKGVFYICLLFVSNIIWTLSCHMSLHNSVIVGIQMRSSVVSVLYRKSLKISNKARAQYTIGEITNYMR